MVKSEQFKLWKVQQKEAERERKLLDYYNQPNPYAYKYVKKDPNQMSDAAMRDAGLTPQSWEEKEFDRMFEGRIDKELKQAALQAKFDKKLESALKARGIQQSGIGPKRESRPEMIEAIKKFKNERNEKNPLTKVNIYNDDTSKNMINKPLFSNNQKGIVPDMFSRNMINKPLFSNNQKGIVPDMFSRNMINKPLFSNNQKGISTDMFSKNMTEKEEEAEFRKKIRGMNIKSQRPSVKQEYELDAGLQAKENIAKFELGEKTKEEAQVDADALRVQRLKPDSEVVTYGDSEEKSTGKLIKEALFDEPKAAVKQSFSKIKKEIGTPGEWGQSIANVATAFDKINKYKDFEEEKKYVREANKMKLKMAKLKQENYVKIQEQILRNQRSKEFGGQLGHLGGARPAGLSRGGNPLGSSNPVAASGGFRNPLDTGRPVVGQRSGNPLETVQLPQQQSVYQEPKKFVFHGLGISSDTTSKNMLSPFSTQSSVPFFKRAQPQHGKYPGQISGIGVIPTEHHIDSTIKRLPRKSYNPGPQAGKRQYVKSGMYDPDINPDFKAKVQYRSVKAFNKKTGEWQIIRIPKDRELSTFEKIDKNIL